MIVDDLILRVGSANLNNRSLGLDSECDLSLRADVPKDRTAHAIFRLRAGLLAEHCGLNPELVEARLAAGVAMADIVASAEPGRSGLYPLRVETTGPVDRFLADNEVLDPETPAEIFEPISKRGLFRQRVWLRRPPR